MRAHRPGPIFSRERAIIIAEDDAKYEVASRAPAENINHARVAPPRTPCLPHAHPHVSKQEFRQRARVVYASLQIELSVPGNLINFPPLTLCLVPRASLVFATYTTRLFLCTLERMSVLSSHQIAYTHCARLPSSHTVLLRR